MYDFEYVYIKFEMFQKPNHVGVSFFILLLYEVNMCIRSEKYHTRYIEAYAIYRISRG